MEKRPLAVVTMAFNEKTMLPLWLRHYERQVGAENCYVLDHGSDDGSTTGIAANLIRLPRMPLDEWERVNTIRDFCTSLFIGFKCVLFTDADELVVVDPDVAPSLSQYMAQRDVPIVLDLFGADVRHVGGEAPIDLQRPVSLQRGYVRPISSLCKATLISKRTDWHIGFHCVVHDHRPQFSDLFLFHLAHCDNDMLFERQKKRNAAAPVGIPDSHHAIPPEIFLDHIKSDISPGLPGEMSRCAAAKTFSRRRSGYSPMRSSARVGRRRRICGSCRTASSDCSDGSNRSRGWPFEPMRPDASAPRRSR